MKRLTWINLLVGIWLIVAPYAMGGATPMARPAFANAVIVGVLLIASSLWILVAPAPAGGGLFQTICGIWLIVAPYLAYGGITSLGKNNVIVGAIVAIVGIVESRAIARLPRAAA